LVPSLSLSTAELIPAIKVLLYEFGEGVSLYSATSEPRLLHHRAVGKGRKSNVRYERTKGSTATLIGASSVLLSSYSCTKSRDRVAGVILCKLCKVQCVRLYSPTARLAQPRLKHAHAARVCPTSAVAPLQLKER
jgi:hypothetical protein